MSTKRKSGWKPSYAEARKKRYSSDPAYRAKCIERSSRRKRSVTRSKPENVNWRNRVRRRSKSVESYASLYSFGGDTFAGFSIHGLSRLVERRPETLRDWIAKGVFPMPTKPVDHAKMRHVYTPEQARGVMLALIEHTDGPNTHLSALTPEAVIALLNSTLC